MKEEQMSRSKLVSEVIKHHRNINGWTQEHLAEISGVSLRTIQRAEKNERLSKETALALASVLKIDVKELVSENGENLDKPEGKVVLLPLILDGKQAIDVAIGADAYDMDYEHVTGEEKGDVGLILSLLRDIGEVGRDAEVSSKLEWAVEIDAMLARLINYKILVFGERKKTVGTFQGKSIEMNIATFYIVKAGHPAIIQENNCFYFSTLVPERQEFQF